jgi:hypothetical protein
MTDPIDMQRANGAPHAGRSRGLPSMSRGPEADRSRAFERGFEQLGRKVRLKTADANADHTMVSHFAHPLEQVACVLDAAIAHQIGDETNLD